MIENPIAAVYWRLIKKGKKNFDSVSETLKNDIKNIAANDFMNGQITEEEYNKLIH